MNSFELIDLKTSLKIHRKLINSRINKVLSHGQYIMGPEVNELEDKLSKYTGAKHCITVASGTDALLISLMSIGIKKGDEIITTPFSFISTAEVIVLLGAKPIFVDIDLKTCNINPNKIQKKITKKTKAIIAVSLFGQPANFDKINEVARDNNIIVLEDAAQSFGSTYNSKKSCNLSTIGCTSFFPSKPLGCFGDGGAIFTNDDLLSENCKKIRAHGATKKYHHELIGVQGRMDTLQCAILLAKLEFFDDEVKKRIKIGQYYNKRFDIIGVQRIQIAKKSSSVFGQYTILLNKRDKIQKLLLDKGIKTSINYPMPISQQKPYRKYTKDIYKNSIFASKKVLSIPMHPYLDKKIQKIIINTINKIKKNLN